MYWRSVPEPSLSIEEPSEQEQEWADPDGEQEGGWTEREEDGCCHTMQEGIIHSLGLLTCDF